MKSVFLLLASLGCMFSTDVSAQIHKCVRNGNVIFSDVPCPPGMAGSVLPLEVRQEGAAAESAEDLDRMKRRLETMQRERQAREAVREEAEREAAALEETAFEESHLQDRGGGGMNQNRKREAQRADRADRADRGNRGNRADRGDRADRGNRGNRADRGDRGRGGRGDRPGRSGRNHGGRRAAI